MTSMAIEVRDLRRSYGEVEAVRGVSFEVARGEVFCLLGSNGAGQAASGAGWALDHDLVLAHLSVSQPTLEDIYLELTGPAPAPHARVQAIA